MNAHHFALALRITAVTQFAIAVLNLRLIPIMKWQDDLAKVSLLVREVFRIHCFFISITLAIFAALTWRFANEIASANNTLAVWLAAAIGAFWFVRSILQWTHYSGNHWHGNTRRTVIHYLLFFGYGAFAAVYFAAAFWRNA